MTMLIRIRPWPPLLLCCLALLLPAAYTQPLPDACAGGPATIVDLEEHGDLLTLVGSWREVPSGAGQGATAFETSPSTEDSSLTFSFNGAGNIPQWHSSCDDMDMTYAASHTLRCFC